jgi:hypothetical protein
MMGGFGSGRPSGSGKSTVESCRSINVNRLHKEGCLVPGWSGGWEWKRDGERVAWISVRTEENRLVLNYRFKRNDEDWQSIEEPVRIIRVPCSYGGSRPYFICPGVVNGITCGRRVVKLYGPGRYFLCRQCYRLAYSSQREDRMDRTLRRANKIRQRLGGDPGMASLFPERPKGMWRRTYGRLRDQTFNAEALADEAFALHAEQLLSRLNHRKGKRNFWS